jgi:ribosome-associated heat shock protein Hsp15
VRLEAIRLDKWLWTARFFRTRALARDAIAGGKVHVAGQRARPASRIRAGDQVVVQRGAERFAVTVLDTGDRRVGADRLGEKFSEHPDSLARRVQQAEAARLLGQPHSDPARRPFSRERRQILRFTRRDP